MHLQRALAIVPVLFVPWLVFGQANPHRLTLEDLISAGAAGETVFSPDGKTIAMTHDGQIALMPSEGGWLETLTSTAGGKSGLDWSPDSRMIAYASQGSIWVVPTAGGVPRRLTHAAAGSGDPRQAGDRQPQWSPKGNWILFETGRKGTNSIVVVSENGASENFVVDSSADEDSPTWSPDGTQISYTERTREHFSGKLNVVKFDPASGRASGDPVTLYTAPTDRGGGWAIPKAQWSPDGRNLAVVLQDSGWDHVYLIPAAGGTPKPVTQGEHENTGPEFSPDGKSLAIVSTRAGLEQSGIWIVPLDGSPARPLAKFSTPGMESQPHWSPDGSRIYFHRMTPLETRDLLVAGVSSGSTPKYLTHTTPRNFDGALTMPERVTFRSKDGLEIAGILYKPKNMKPGERHAAVLWIHGGPEAQDGFQFDGWAQYLAQSGYVVLKPNYRGSSGYGEKFRNLNVEDSGGAEVDDVAAGAEYLVKQGLADSRKLAIGGGSHGGTMVGYAVTKYPDLFAAAIELFGVVDRATFNERTNRNSAIRWMMKMGGSADEKPEVYRKANSLLGVAKIKTPVLIMHGEDDPQVPPYESVQFARALKEQGKVYYYFTYPNELHGFSQSEHRLDAWRKQLAFLERYIQPRFGLSSTSTDDFMLQAPIPAQPIAGRR